MIQPGYLSIDQIPLAREVVRSHGGEALAFLAFLASAEAAIAQGKLDERRARVWRKEWYLSSLIVEPKYTLQRIQDVIREIEIVAPSWFEGLQELVVLHRRQAEGLLREFIVELSRRPVEACYQSPDQNYFRQALNLLYSGQYTTLFGEHTPGSLVRLGAGIVNIPAGAKVFDPACGTGGLLLEMQRQTKASSVCGLDSHPHALVYARLQAFLHSELDASFEQSEITEWTEQPVSSHFDLVISNPPFSVRLNPQQRMELPDSRLSSLKTADLLFVHQMLQCVKREGGQVVVMLPLGALAREGAEADLRMEWLEKGFWKTIIQLPPGLFAHTNIPVCLCVLSWKKNEAKQVRLVNVLLPGQSLGSGKISLDQEDIARILGMANGTEEGAEKILVGDFKYEQIQENGSSLLPSHFLRTALADHRLVPEVESDLAMVSAELEDVRSSIEELRGRLSPGDQLNMF